LTGPIPSTFSKLTSLRKLRFKFNNLEGPWSEGLLDNMTNLDKLDLAYNDFNMTLPRDIGKRTSLEKLDFAGNKIHGSIPSEYGRLYELSKSFHFIIFLQYVTSIPSHMG
jgi:Leucine-rich repeat (LRR) protein